MSPALPPDELTRLVVDADAAGQRLDAFLASRLVEHSRARLRGAIDAGHVTVDGQQRKGAYRLRAGESISITVPEPVREGPEPEKVPLEILFEDAWLVAINKPAGMVVHPARGHWSGTLAAALAYHFDQLSGIGGATRPGIVHRLDRDTSGVIVIAKSDQAHLALASQFEQRTTEKEYAAIVVGVPDRDRDIINQPIGPHPHKREKMAIRDDHPSSRPAETFYEVQRRFQGFALVRAFPKTGRTHQIRLHLAHAGFPVLCDRLYGGRAQISLGELAGGCDDGDIVLGRQALHARRLKLKHPDTGREMEFTAPLPEDIERTLARLAEYRGRC
jgi:23S rRNA pseudouridine1911/1915/1917 synthase